MLLPRPALSILALLTAAACGPTGAEDPDGADTTLEPGPGAFVADVETSPDFVTLMAGPVQGDSPHGRVQIWYSRNAESLLELTTFTAPVGTVAIKSSVDADGVVQNYTVMIKEEAGFDAEHGDWRYEMRTPAGEIANDPDSGMPMSGAITMCIDCHQASAGTDFLAGTGLR